MATRTNKLEDNLNDLFVKRAPALPVGGKKFLFEWAPIISVILGILMLLSSWTLWNWANTATSALSYANEFCDAYSGTCGVVTPHYTVWLWMGVIILAAEGLMYLFAYAGLRVHKKQGWNYLYFGALMSILYAVISLLNSYDVLGQFVGSLIGATIGLYLLFQIREAYVGKPWIPTGKPVVPSASLPYRLG